MRNYQKRSYKGSSYTFFFSHTTQVHPFFKFDSERANILTAQYFSASCIDFGASLYSVVAYLKKCDS